MRSVGSAHIRDGNPNVAKIFSTVPAAAGEIFTAMKTKSVHRIATESIRGDKANRIPTRRAATMNNAHKNSGKKNSPQKSLSFPVTKPG